LFSQAIETGFIAQKMQNQLALADTAAAVDGTEFTPRRALSLLEHLEFFAPADERIAHVHGPLKMGGSWA
jgi:hypothetical protein